MTELDPLIVIFKLAILSKKEKGTKISLYCNTIHINELTKYQGLFRYFNYSNKYDLQYLLIPIEKACQLYLTKYMCNKLPDIIMIFRTAQDGLNVLMNTYSTKSKTDKPIIFLLQNYIDIIESYIDIVNNKKKKKDIILRYSATGYFNLTNIIEDHIPSDEEKIDTKIWTYDKINECIKYVKYMNESKLLLYENYLENCLEKICELK
jgi:hypothetical protein